MSSSNKTFSVSMHTPEQKQTIERVAREHGYRSGSDMIRRVLFQHIRQYKLVEQSFFEIGGDIPQSSQNQSGMPRGLPQVKPEQG